jgi:hypothetical protein
VLDEPAWRKALLEERAGTDAEMKSSPTSPLAAIERHILPAAAPTYVRVEADAARLAPEAQGAAVVFRPAASGPWTWDAVAPGVTGTSRDGKAPVAPGPITQPLRISLGRFTLLAQPVEATFVVSIYDAQAEPLRTFTGLVHFAPDARYAVSATLERANDPAVVTMQTSIGLAKTFRRYGELRFAIGGSRVALAAFVPVGAEGSLFVPFRDATSGTATYPAGRYLDLEMPPAGQRTVVVDFNRAYSPMCSFSPAFNCPLPPAENHLAVAIEAGEKTYPH